MNTENICNIIENDIFGLYTGIKYYYICAHIYWGIINTVLRRKNKIVFGMFRLFSVLSFVVFGIHKDPSRGFGLM